MSGGLLGGGGNLLNQLQTEYALLASETRRKNPEIKAAAEEVLILLRAVKEEPGLPNVSEQLSRHRGPLNALVMASQSSNAAKLLPLVITILHRLITHAAIPTETGVMMALEIMERMVGLNDEVQLKCLQCMMPLLTHYTDHIHGSSLFKAYEVCFRLQNARSMTVVNAAVAIIRQLIIWLFEKVIEEDNEKITEGVSSETVVQGVDGKAFKLRLFAADAFVIFQDICLLANEERALVLPVLSINKAFALELIESVLACNSQIFRQHPELAELVRDRICTLAIRRLGEKCDFAQACRLWRVAGILMREFYELLPHQAYTLLSSTLLGALEGAEEGWERALALETCRDLFSSYDLFCDLYVLCEGENTTESTHPMQDLIIAVNSQILSLVARLSGQSDQQQQALFYAASLIKVPYLQQLDKSSPPTLNNPYLLLLAHDCLVQLFGGMLESLKSSCEPDARIIPVSTERIGLLRTFEANGGDVEGGSRQAHVANLLLPTIWASNLRALNTAITNCRLDSTWQNQILQTLAKLVTLLAITQMSDALDAILKVMVEMALPEYQQQQGTSPARASPSAGLLLVSDLNLAASTIILQLALSIDELLRGSWKHVIRVIHGVDYFAIFKAKRMPGVGGGGIDTSVAIGSGSGGHPLSSQPSTRRSSIITSSSTTTTPTNELDWLGDLTELARSLIENSRNLGEESFEHFLQALCTLSSELISAESTGNTSLSNARVTLVLFPVQKLKQLALLNVSRFAIAAPIPSWDLLLDHLTAVTVSSDAALRGLGCEAVNLAVTQLSATISGGDVGFSQVLQERLLLPLHRLIKHSSWTDVHKAALESLLRVLQNLGPSLSSGWSIVFDIINATLQSNADGIPPNLSIIRAAFVVVKLLCAEFLTNLTTEGIHETVKVLARFARVHEDLNLSLTAIGLLWDVADNVRQRRSLKEGEPGKEKENSIQQDQPEDMKQFSQRQRKGKRERRNKDRGKDRNKEQIQETDQNTTNGGLHRSYSDLEETMAKVNDDFKLWVLILMQFRSLAVDDRPEVRNSSIQTLTRAVEIGGTALHLDEWGVVLDQTIMPLLKEVPQVAQSRPDEISSSTLPVTFAAVVAATATSTSTGAKDNLAETNLVHHSRDSKEKQWSETQLLMLQGVTQLYRVFLGELARLDSFSSIYWDQLLMLVGFYGDASRTPSAELAAAAVSSLIGLLTSERMAEVRTQDELWEEGWRCWCQIGMSMETSSIFTQETLVLFARIFPPLYDLLKERRAHDLEWLAVSWRTLNQALRCPTPKDHVKDFDVMTELQKTVVDQLDALFAYDGDNRDVRPLYLRHLAGWLEWLRELSSVEMTRQSSQRRTRLSTSSSSFNSLQRTAGLAGGACTYVALAIATLERLKRRIGAWCTDRAIYEDGTLAMVVRAVGRLMWLKYRAPSGSGPFSLWKLATRTFNTITNAILPHLAKLSSGQSESIWLVIVQVLEQYLETSRTQIPRELALDQLDADEEFDVAQVHFMRDAILPLMEEAPVELVRRLLVALEISSRLYSPVRLQIGEEGPTSPWEGASFAATTPVVKEKFAVVCLKSLFLICSDRRQRRPDDLAGGDELARRHKSGELLGINLPTLLPPMPLSIVQACLGILLQRCNAVLQSYTEDGLLLGKMPFPRVRQDEIIFVLQELNTLRLSPNLLLNGEREETSAQQRICRTLVNTPLGHLFYLYPRYCECLPISDPFVLELVQRAFALMGLELGLVPTTSCAHNHLETF